MPDTIFDMIDRRTIVIVVFSIVLTNILFGFQLPVDVNDPQKLVVDLVILTGYIYLVRSIYRLPVALYESFRISLHEVRQPKNKLEKAALARSRADSLGELVGSKRRRTPSDRTTLSADKESNVHTQPPMNFRIFLAAFGKMPKHLFTFGRLHIGVYRRYSSFDFILFALAILDRAALVAISILFVLPVLYPFNRILGISGIVFMILVFISTGTFTGLIQDNLENASTVEIA